MDQKKGGSPGLHLTALTATVPATLEDPVAFLFDRFRGNRGVGWPVAIDKIESSIYTMII